MTYDPHDTRSIAAGTPVYSARGAFLGVVREAYTHYLLVDQEDEHEDLTIPAHAILSHEGGRLEVSVNRDSASAVDHEETAHHLLEDNGKT